MRYLLTLEKFKSNILSKVFKIANSDNRFRMILTELLEKHDIKISDLKDEHFKYIPVNKISKNVEYIEIENYKFYDEDGNYIEGSLKEGDFLLENDGFVHKIKKIGSFDLDYKVNYMTTNIYPGINSLDGDSFASKSLKKFIKIPKEHSDNLIIEDEKELRGLRYSLKISKDQVWEYGNIGDIKKDTLYKIIDDSDGYSYPDKNYINDHLNDNIVMDFNLKSLIKYKKETFGYGENDIILGFNYENKLNFYARGKDILDKSSDDLKRLDNDYLIILNMEKAKSDISSVGKQRDERKKGKEDSPHFMKDSDILKMNKERLISKLINRYKLSEKDVENLKEYTDFKRIFNKIVSKNPLLVLEDNSIWELVIKMIKGFESINRFSNQENIKREIEVLNEHFEKIISHPLVINKINLFEGIRKHSDESIKMKISNIENDLLILGNKIQSYINNFEYDNLNDLYVITNKIKSYKDTSSNIGFFLNSESIGYERRMVNTKDEIEQVLKDELVSIFNFSPKKLDYIHSNIKTLIKIW